MCWVPKIMSTSQVDTRCVCRATLDPGGLNKGYGSAAPRGHIWGLYSPEVQHVWWGLYGGCLWPGRGIYESVHICPTHLEGQRICSIVCPQSGPICEKMRSAGTEESRKVRHTLWIDGLRGGKYVGGGCRWATPEHVCASSTHFYPWLDFSVI